jgi:2-keto-4-pentenoate hydratase/2-oxohepta-3-ene-1,7-dioic acid hydratase in catechol pathway
VRLARIAHPKYGVAFASIEGEGTDPDQLTAVEIADHPFGSPVFTGRKWPLAESRILAPILPGKVVCIGKNYADHIAEMGGAPPENPIIFLKPTTTVIGPDAPIRIPRNVGRVEFEGELAVVIGTAGRDIPAEKASSVILGYTVANDVTAREVQYADGQWTRGKGYDSFCPLGPWIETEFDPLDVGLETSVDGEVHQDARTSDLIHGIGEIIEWISAVMTLLPGDVILTGTPAGVGPIVAGQKVSVTIEGLGTLTNPVELR